MPAKPSPVEIKVAEGLLRITWNDGHASRYHLRDVRMACRCAACIDEWTHQSMIIPERIPADVRPTEMEPVGHYALHFTWSDGHNTGIYSYDALRELCDCDDCRAKRSFSV